MSRSAIELGMSWMATENVVESFLFFFFFKAILQTVLSVHIPKEKGIDHILLLSGEESLQHLNS